MNGHLKVNRTESSAVYSQASQDSLSSSGDWRYQSFSGGSANDLATATCRQGSSNLASLTNQLPTELRNTTWEIRKEISRFLNPLKDPVGNDYRLVASRLGFRVEDIEAFGKADNPTMEMIKHCNTASCEQFFSVVQDIGRSDVIDDLLSYLNHNHAPHHLPTQASLEEKDSLSHPLEESWSDVSKLSKQPSEQEDDQEEKLKIPFEESQKFWCNIPGPYSKKKWSDFCTAMKNSCPVESDHGGIEKFLCYLFIIDYDSRPQAEVKMEFFIRLLSCFGPFEAGKNGCLEKIYELTKKSLSKSIDGKRHSWFAGYMNLQETHDRLDKLSPGHFLIRFSSSRVDDGWFILGVKTTNDVVQIEIKEFLHQQTRDFDVIQKVMLLVDTRDVIGRKYLLAEESFEDLPSIVERLRKEIFLEECRQLLINPCPDLPLNVTLIGYTTVTRVRRGRGRGRIR